MTAEKDSGEKYRCWVCQSKDVYVKAAGVKVGLYCVTCGSWVRWLSGNDLKHAYFIMKRRGLLPDNLAYKHVEQRRNKNLIRCSACRCRLWDSSLTSAEGQFDMREARYCPKCGKRIAWMALDENEQ